MDFATLIARNISCHWRANLAAAGGFFLAAWILAGSLGVGDTLRNSLSRIAEEHIGKTGYAVLSSSHLIRPGLSDTAGAALKTKCSAVMLARGTASSDGGRKRANRIQVVGVDAGFADFSPACGSLGLKAGECLVNGRTADALGIGPGGEIVVRIGKAAAGSTYSAFIRDKDISSAVNLKVAGILPPEKFGNFSIGISQISPCNIFVDRKFLSERLGTADSANLFLVGEPGGLAKEEDIKAAFLKSLNISDLGIAIREIPERGLLQLESDGIFLDSAEADAAMASGSDPLGVFCYFVNEISSKASSTPYSFVSSLPDSAMVPDLTDGQIIVNQWLADDLSAVRGDKLVLKYFLPKAGTSLEEVSSGFEVAGVVPVEGAASDRFLMPDFKGIGETEKCGDWDPSLPISLSKIRPKDEDYWMKYRGTPKAFVTLADARKMWGGPKSSLTAVRYLADKNSSGDIAAKFMLHASGSSLGISVLPVGKNSRDAVANSIDFGGLFTSMSFFVIVSSLLLSSLILSFNIQNRRREISTMLSTGFSKTELRGIFLGEGMISAILGTFAGTLSSPACTGFLAWALAHAWNDAVRTSQLQVTITGTSMAIGFTACLLAASATVFFTCHRQFKGNLIGLARDVSDIGQGVAHPGRWFAAGVALSVAGLAFSSGIFGFGETSGPGMFFLSGVAFLAASSAIFMGWMGKYRMQAGDGILQLHAIALRNLCRSRGRSMSVFCMVALPVFILAAVAVNRKSPSTDAGSSVSGTGGFQLFCETSIPVPYDPSSPQGIRKLGIEDAVADGASFVRMMVDDGDDASCLNLNQVTRPRLLGVDPDQFISRGAFKFAGTYKEVKGSPWTLLKEEDAIVNGVADKNMIQWQLRKSLGDIIEIPDADGGILKVRLAAALDNSILQGGIVVSTDVLSNHFPSAGYKIFLVDIKSPSVAEKATSQIAFALEDYGVEVVSSTERLDEFWSVERTYIDIFLVLGGFGLILGTAGLGMVILRNGLDRRREIAVLTALGFSRGEIYRLLSWEHSFVFAAGLLAGVFSAVIPQIPAHAGLAGIASPVFATVIALIAAFGFFWIAEAARFAVSRNPADTMRNG